MGREWLLRWGLLAIALLVPGCGAHHGRPSVAPTPFAGPMPQPPPGAAPGLTIPEPGDDGRYTTINSGVNAQEALWHVRAALNVAALSCGHRPGGSDIVLHYNALLTQRKAVFATAYAAETGRFGTGGQEALDVHMTRLYNFFAQPPAQAGFCAAAADVADHAANVPPQALSQFAIGALGRLEAPVLDYYRAYGAYRRELVAWNARPRADVRERGPVQLAAEHAERLAAPPSAASSGVPWRIQLGAFTGQLAAEAAWARARLRLPMLATYRPHYQTIPGRPLVRLQVGSAEDRAGALRLCAAAAAGGFDCLPVPR